MRFKKLLRKLTGIRDLVAVDVPPGKQKKPETHGGARGAGSSGGLRDDARHVYKQLEVL